jgi:hypothetical protein|tara:strand:- start:371 stop:625 length:255 start_codon:yes stop_codon:yes gene_type:complete
MNNGNNPANPLTGDAYIDFSVYDETKGGESSYNPECQGLTKREAFAMAAMQGLIASDIENIYTTTDIAEISVTQADALLKELAK